MHTPLRRDPYRANIVTYAIARFAADVECGDHCFDFDVVWRKQGVSEKLREALTIAASAVHDVIIDPPAGMRNVTEWAKQEACWTRVSALKISWPAGLLDSLRTVENQRDIRRAGIKEQRILNGIEAQIAVTNAGAAIWRQIKEWGEQRQLLTETELSILDVACSLPGRIPSDKQSVIIIEILKKLHKEGCQLGKNVI